jgi:hypothetical protein
MHSDDEDAARRTRTLVSREIDGPGGVRDLAMRSNLSEATIRKIASTGIVSSHVVAAAIELATDGRVRAVDIEQPGAKGRDLYGREPARTLLCQALTRGTSVTALLASYGISHQDLWTYMNHDARGSDAVRRRVASALQHAGIEAEEPA